MFQENTFVQFLHESGLRGSDQFGSVNWAMGMAQRSWGRGTLGLSAMFSADLERHAGSFTSRYLRRFGAFQPGVGAGVSLGIVPETLKDDYGNRANVGAAVYVTFRPAR